MSIIYTDEELKEFIGEKAYKELIEDETFKKLIENQSLLKNNNKRFSELAQKYKNFTMSEDRINQILNAKNEDHLQVTREEAEYLGLQIVDESYFK
ncbi:MAG: hypothetical protein PUB15_06710 [Ruminobacter sp.]|nr:hypothetical protein [Ruminobacter sp.]